VPEAHLRPLDTPETDPVAVLKRFIGTPYVWAGNTGFGIDCSGLVQAALLACGQPCPGDSDLQEQALGRPLAAGEPLERGDLIFWKGHVAMAVDEATLIHANAHAMAVAYEGAATAIARIEAQGGGQTTSRRRFL
jgi:cell wall-associated NlpC family hydrolase